MDGILYMNVNILKDDILFQKAMTLIPKDRQEKINSFQNPIPARLSLGAGVLLHIAMERFHLSHQKENIRYDTHGKPYLEGEGSDFHFNLSHSGDYAVCAFSDSPIGIDLQKIKETIPRYLQKILSEEEQQYQQNLQTSNRAEFFYKIWSRKESLIKWDGRGLHIPLHQYSFIQNKTILNKLYFEGTPLFFIDFQYLMPQYSLCICTEKETFVDFLEEIDAIFLANY